MLSLSAFRVNKSRTPDSKPTTISPPPELQLQINYLITSNIIFSVLLCCWTAPAPAETPGTPRLSPRSSCWAGTGWCAPRPPPRPQWVGVSAACPCCVRPLDPPPPRAPWPGCPLCWGAGAASPSADSGPRCSGTSGRRWWCCRWSGAGRWPESPPGCTLGCGSKSWDPWRYAAITKYILFCFGYIRFTWFGPLGSGSYRSDRVVKGFRELRNVHAMKSIFYCENSFPHLRGTTGPDTFLISIIL